MIQKTKNSKLVSKKYLGMAFEKGGEFHKKNMPNIKKNL